MSDKDWSCYLSHHYSTKQRAIIKWKPLAYIFSPSLEGTLHQPDLRNSSDDYREQIGEASSLVAVSHSNLAY